MGIELLIGAIVVGAAAFTTEQIAQQAITGDSMFNHDKKDKKPSQQGAPAAPDPGASLASAQQTAADQRRAAIAAGGNTAAAGGGGVGLPGPGQTTQKTLVGQ